jgi:hypothetical protein
MSNTFNSLVDAVTASGKRFSEISKDSIFAFLDKQGESRNTWESTYQKLSDVFNTKKKTNSSSGFGGSSLKEDRTHKSSVVDYTDNSHNDVKVRQPRKSIFGEIKKVAG